jgi:hypothetical protein
MHMPAEHHEKAREAAESLAAALRSSEVQEVATPPPANGE